jgi:hypothetical protein
MRLVHVLRLCVVCIFSLFIISNSDAATIDDVAKEFPAIYGKLSKLASSSVSAMSVDSAGMLLLEVKKRIKGVQSVLRINSSGTVINEITQSGSTIAMRSVADQKWFVDVKDKNSPYFGSSREAGGNYLLFWAWPIQTVSGGFAGVLAVKLDAASIFQGICSGDSVHFAAFYNENLLYRCGNDRYTFKEESEWLLPDSSKITLRWGAAAAVVTNEIDQNVGNDTEKPQIAEPVKENSVALKTENDNPYSRKKVDTRVGQNGGSNLLLYILLSIALVSGFLLFQAKFNKRSLASFVNRDKSGEQFGIHDENHSDALSSGSLRAEMVDVDEEEKDELMDEVPESVHEDVIVQTKNETDTPEISDEAGPLSAEEACEKIKELIGDSDPQSLPSVKLSSSLSSTDEALRRELYREIHGQIIHWVTCESSRLSQSLKELSDRVGKLENVNDPEVMRIRSEANRISKEISAFKDNPSGQVFE